MKVDRRTALTGALAGGAAALLPTPLLARGSRAPSPPPDSQGEPRWGKGFEDQRKADLGDATFLNPIVACDHPAPTTLKDGADYYMTFSTFDSYPGLVIWHSRDLVNWRPVTAALARNSGSVWAPELIRHKGRYFIYIPVKASPNTSYVIWADRIEGPWSDPIDLKLPNHIDPGHAVGEDGSR